MVPPRATCEIHGEMLVDMAATIGDLLIDMKKESREHDLIVRELALEIAAVKERLRGAAAAGRTIVEAINAIPSNADLKALHADDIVDVLDAFAADVETPSLDLCHHLGIDDVAEPIHCATDAEGVCASLKPHCALCDAHGEAASVGEYDLQPKLPSSPVVTPNGLRYTIAHLVTCERVIDGEANPNRFVANALGLCFDCSQALEEFLEQRAPGAAPATGEHTKPDRIGDAA